MVCRLDKCITRGEVDNTERGRVVGRLWLLGRDEPLELDLQGDAWPDIAGCKLSFVNPKARAQPAADELGPLQRGLVGDITGSNKCKVPDFSGNNANLPLEDIPFVWKNCLYLEWFSESNGRVLVETTDFEVTISERQWELDDDDHQAQQMLNLQAMRDYISTMGLGPDLGPEDLPWPGDVSEDAWEEHLKKGDRINEVAKEVFEKYQDEPDHEQKQAFVMGWDHLIKDGEADDEPKPEEMSDKAADVESAGWNEKGENLVFESVDELLAHLERHAHPLEKQTRAFGDHAAAKLEDLVIGAWHDEDDDDPPPRHRFIGNLFLIADKLSTVLSTNSEDQKPRGYVLAITKRCLKWANEAFAALAEMMNERPDAVDELNRLRDGLFEIRDGITDIRRELQGE